MKKGLKLCDAYGMEFEVAYKIAAFVEFYLTEARKLVREVGYVPLGESAYAEALELVKGANIKYQR